MHNDGIPGCDGFNKGPNFDNLTDTFVSEKVRKILIGTLNCVYLVDLCPTDTAILNVDPNLPGL
jgi:hypothetical protein